MAAPVRKYVRIQEKGQVTLPARMRRALNLKKGDLVAVEPTADGVLIRPVDVQEVRTGSPWLKELYDQFAPAREEILARGISEEEVNDDIDRAIREVRAARAGNV